MLLKRSMAFDVVEKVGEVVKLCGWAQTVRDHGSLIFVDLRDWSGVVQVVIDEKDKKNFEIAKTIGSEYVLSLEGKVVERQKKLQNEKIPTGKIEVKVSKIEVLNKSKTPPFPLSDDGRDIDEFVRLKYRYIDIRRKRVRDLIEKRHNLLNFVTKWFSDNDFVQVQTPLLTVSSPEGARDFLVPSRLYPGHFYALPQAPQQYKQLLMVGGLHRYFQIAPCLRDEDPRTDRHYGTFYQVDAELSFVTQDEIFDSVEPFFKEVIEKFTEKKLKQYPIPRISYKDIVNLYGSDKADLRFDMKLVDLTEFFKSSAIDIFKDIELAKGILVDKEFSRKEIEIWTDNVKKARC
jgi:aspartyl-tRNA synthetase